MPDATAPRFHAELDLASPEATARLASRLGALLRPGDTLLLSGPVGAGKSHFARALIRARQVDAGMLPEDVPSPTFTLVQTYAAGPVDLWHADLYRLTDPGELVELGLDEAFDAAICLVEWPDRLGELAPPGALSLDFLPGPDDDSRRLAMDGPTAWGARLSDLTEPDDD